MIDRFYREFEENFRGSRETILKRLEVYLPFVEPLQLLYPNALVLDLGCGRGEWLELLKIKKIKSVGVDLDLGMLENCADNDLNTVCKDALEFLKQQKDGSFSVVTAFHLVEHLSFEKLKDIVAESFRVLKDGGLLIMETPNPENLVVSTQSFYLDPTHLRPIPPDLLSFIPKFFQYETIKVIRLQEDQDLKNNDDLSLQQILSGTSPDYAVIAQKKAPQDLKIGMKDLFERELGLSNDFLFNRHRIQELLFKNKIVKELADINSGINEIKLTLEKKNFEIAQLKNRLLDKQSRIDSLLNHPTQKGFGIVSHFKIWIQDLIYQISHKLLSYFNILGIKSFFNQKSILYPEQYLVNKKNYNGDFVFVSSKSILFDSKILNEQILSKSKLIIHEMQNYPLNLHREEKIFLPAFDLLYIPASDPRLLSECGFKKDGLIIVAKAMHGFALYGPYLDLEPGKYSIRIILSTQHNHKGTVWMDVVSSLSKIQHACKKFILARLPKGAGELSLEIHSAEPIIGFEARILCEHNVELAITGLEVTLLR